MSDDVVSPRRSNPDRREGVVGRRVVLGGLALGALGLVACAPNAPSAAAPPAGPDPGAVQARLAEVEARFGGRLGVHALDTGTGATLSHRAGERFLMCSTSKAPTVAAVLRRAQDEPDLLGRRVTWSREQIADGNSPVGESAVDTGLTVAELCGAAVVVSDNTAQNRLLELLGGPAAMTAFVRGLGDPVTRFDRFEPELNRGAAGDERDTTTPETIVGVLRAVALGEALTPASRDRLVGWMVETTTGLAQIRAGVPAGWRVADKTGSGAAGESHDIGVVWPPGRAPIVVAVYTDPTDPANVTGKATIAAATRTVLDAFVPR